MTSPVQWMSDFDAFQRALDADDSYAASLSRSLSLVLDEFYENLTTVGVSSLTGEGMDELFEVRCCTSISFASSCPVSLLCFAGGVRQ